ncbi:MAG TPA: branched-chain amino acid ABC transporter permease [Paracoccaceae bacterium]|nr:branched-chain amino acid ABC transporter permease [Paracoccaceae bacterium]
MGRDAILGLPIESTQTFHFVVLALLVLVLVLLHRLSQAPFGLALLGIASDERRMTALGFATSRLQLACFVISAGITGLALAANFYYFVSPAYLHWIVSGEFLVMVALGGLASLSGGLFGALVLILAEAVLSQYTTYWRILLGPAVILAVLYLRAGVHPALQRLLGARDA